MKILPLRTYNAILGMDWLESHNPMTVDWKGKSLVLTTPAGPAFLRGDASSVQFLQINSVQMMEIQAVLMEFDDIFQEPTELPPRHACDHTIPLIPEAQPVNMRPYRHKPEHKNEIERQIAELLRQGVIQRSSSPFSSPVILVKKKDGSWRLCIDYRHLNFMTHIGKFPIPVIDELLDELHGAVWSYKLDLRAGYH